MKPRISMITLGTRDLAKAVQFYEQGLGLPRMAFEGEGIAFFQLNGTWLGVGGCIVVKVLALLDRREGGTEELQRRGYDFTALMAANTEGKIEVLA